VSSCDVTTCKTSVDSKLLQHLAEVDCGCFSLSFRVDSAALPGLGVLEISLRKSHALNLNSTWLSSVMDRVFTSGLDFVVLCDFRSREGEFDFMDVLAPLWQDHAELWGARVKSAALLITENLFHAAASRPVRSFLQACAPGCPFVVCHGRAAAKEFFRAGLREQKERRETEAPFVSVVGVQEHGDKTPGVCLASLAPLRPGSGAAAHTFHMLPNGDVRVIQSPGECVVQEEAEVTESDKKSSRISNAAFGSLKLQYSMEKLQNLVGTYFHVGELFIDAELESALRKSSVGGMLPMPELSSKARDGCFGGLQSRLYNCIHRILNALENGDDY